MEATSLEAVEERRVNRQVVNHCVAAGSVGLGLALPGLGGKSRRRLPEAPPEIPRGGKHDQSLLRPGGAGELRVLLPQLFSGTDATDCGRTNGRTAGRGCVLAGSADGVRPSSYPSEAFSAGAVVEHLEGLAAGFWEPVPEANLLRITVPRGTRLLIVGDTHGQLEDVLWMFFKYGPPSSTNWYLFNGDIVDRGSHALEILLLLFAYKRDCPEAVHILRGNHEDASCVLHYGFRAELESKFPESLSDVWNALTTGVFPRIPIAAIVSDSSGSRQIGVFHGGVPVGLADQEGPVHLEGDLKRISRSRQTLQRLAESDVDGRLLYGLLWADPAESEEEKANSGSRAAKFVEADTQAFCERNEIALIVRSHEVPRSLRGAWSSHSGRCLTVFSASNYTGSVGNLGGVLECQGEPLDLHVHEHWAPPWPRLARILASDGTASDSVAAAAAVMEWEAEVGLETCEAGCTAESLTPLPAPFASLSVSAARAATAAPSPSETSTGPRAESRAAAMAQRAQFMTERLVEHKDELFERLSAADPYCTGCVVKVSWARNLLEVLTPHCEGLLSPAVVEELWAEWGLSEPVKYVRFLHRFQLRDSPADGSFLVDRIQAVTKLHAQLVNFSTMNLEHLLDPNGDKTVTRQEFSAFLPMFHVQVPPWQAAALYETMSNIVGQHPITLDSSILCLALVSQDPPESLSDALGLAAEAVGRQILGSGMTFAGAFRTWDTTHDGFLSLDELEVGLRSLPLAASPGGISPDEARACCQRLHSMTAHREKVSMFDFVRAVAPSELTLELQGTLIKEVLKHVWRCRPALLDALARADPDASNVIGLEAFKDCVREINPHLERRGLHSLGEIQVNVICEIAAAGRDQVRYEDFLRGLHVEDVGAPLASPASAAGGATTPAAEPASVPAPTAAPLLLLPGLGGSRRHGRPG